MARDFRPLAHVDYIQDLETGRNIDKNLAFIDPFTPSEAY